MSALSYLQIRQALTHPDLAKRLVVSPILDPHTQLKDNQAAIDVRLGRAFSVVRAWTEGVAELLPGKYGTSEPHVDRFVLQLGEPLIVHPHQLVLARTLEVVRLPQGLMSYVIGRSSWGRRGLIVATAVVVHPGFCGPITLELKNVGEVPIALYPLDRIAQLTFHEVGSGGELSTTVSQFFSTFHPGMGTVRDPSTLERLEVLAADSVKRRT